VGSATTPAALAWAAVALLPPAPCAALAMTCGAGQALAAELLARGLLTVDQEPEST
jgi:hypothetical protein